jgi:hypothetical protein
MGIFEFLGEVIAPKPVGSLKARRPEASPRVTGAVIAHAAASTATLGLLLYVSGLTLGLAGVIACGVYVFAGTVLRPRPDLDNIGWLWE